MQRGHGDWGARPYTDVMAITDAVVKRPDIDDTRVSFVAGWFQHTLRSFLDGSVSF